MVALATLLKAIYSFTQDDAQHRIVRALGISASLTSKIYRRLQNVCSVDLQNTLLQGVIFKWWRGVMQLLCCQLYRDAFFQALKCTLTIGQHTTD